MGPNKTFCEKFTPVLAALIDSIIILELAVRVSLFTGVSCKKLVLVGRLCCTWLYPSLCILWFDDQCVQAWMPHWEPCKDDNHDSFSQSYPVCFVPKHGHLGRDECVTEIEITKKADICSARTLALVYQAGDCGRAVIETLGPLLLRKKLVQAIVIPLITIAASLCYSSSNVHLQNIAQ